jgi:hypothetical protein
VHEFILEKEGEGGFSVKQTPRATANDYDGEGFEIEA